MVTMSESANIVSKFSNFTDVKMIKLKTSHQLLISDDLSDFEDVSGLNNGVFALLIC